MKRIPLPVDSRRYGWVSRSIGAEVTREIEFPLHNLPSRGAHAIRLTAHVGTERPTLDETISYPPVGRSSW